MPTSTCVYLCVLLLGFGLQYACDLRCITRSAAHMHLTVTGIRLPALALYFQATARCYRLRIRDQHGRTSTRLCRVTGVIGQPMEVALDPIPLPVRRS